MPRQIGRGHGAECHRPVGEVALCQRPLIQHYLRMVTGVVEDSRAQAFQFLLIPFKQLHERPPPPVAPLDEQQSARDVARGVVALTGPKDVGQRRFAQVMRRLTDIDEIVQ